MGPTLPLWQTTTSKMELIVGVGITEIVTVSVSWLHGPWGSFVVRVRIIVPINPAGGE